MLRRGSCAALRGICNYSYSYTGASFEQMLLWQSVSLTDSRTDKQRDRQRCQLNEGSETKQRRNSRRRWRRRRTAGSWCCTCSTNESQLAMHTGIRQQQQQQQQQLQQKQQQQHRQRLPCSSIHPRLVMADFPQSIWSILHMQCVY